MVYSIRDRTEVVDPRDTRLNTGLFRSGIFNAKIMITDKQKVVGNLSTLSL